jgi:hypothetical protein
LVTSLALADPTQHVLLWKDPWVNIGLKVLQVRGRSILS